jgi:hypothetical protein
MMFGFLSDFLVSYAPSTCVFKTFVLSYVSRKTTLSLFLRKSGGRAPT